MISLRNRGVCEISSSAIYDMMNKGTCWNPLHWSSDYCRCSRAWNSLSLSSWRPFDAKLSIDFETLNCRPCLTFWSHLSNFTSGLFNLKGLNMTSIPIWRVKECRNLHRLCAAFSQLIFFHFCLFHELITTFSNRTQFAMHLEFPIRLCTALISKRSIEGTMETHTAWEIHVVGGSRCYFPCDRRPLLTLALAGDFLHWLRANLFVLITNRKAARTKKPLVICVNWKIKSC